jgi:hypothetical protein
MNDGDIGGTDTAGIAVRDKMTEYRLLVAPVEQAINELHHARGLLRARAESEIHAIAPALAALSEALQISTLDLLLAPDRQVFLQEAFAASNVSPEAVREKVLAAASGGTAETLGLLSAEDKVS